MLQSKLIKLGWILVCLGFHAAQAQQAFQLFGRVTDSAGVALSHATISIFSSQDTLISLTQDDGSFGIINLPQTKFKLGITMKGFLPFSRSYSVSTEKRIIKLGTITLKADYNELDPVTISRVRPITFQTDTVSYHVAAFPVRDGSEVEDVLKRLPGIEVDMNGNVIVQGKKVQKVTVNGKDFFGGDVLLAIRNLPADVVDKLQIIDDYGDKARLTGVKSGEPAKVLNIVMKADKRNGEFGNAQVSGGDYGKYAGNAFANGFKGDRQTSINVGLSNNSPTGNNPTHNEGISYANQWDPRWSGAINYGNDGQDSRSSGSSIQDNFYSGGQLHQTQNNKNSLHNSNNALTTTFTYKPDNYSTLRFTSSASLLSTSAQSSSNFTTLQQDDGFVKSTAGSTSSKSQASEQAINSNMYYEKLSPHSQRRFSAEFVASYSNNRQIADNFSTAIVTLDSASTNSLLHYFVTNTSPSLNLNFNSTYFQPLGTRSFLELGYIVQSTQSRTNLLTQEPDSANTPPITVDSLTLHQSFRTFTQNLHIGHSAHFHKLDLSAGIDAQPGMIESSTPEKGNITSYRYFSLVPKLEGAWIFNKSQKINLSYGSHPNLPGLSQLTSLTNVTNPQYPVIGNPSLKPSYTNNISLHYEQSSLRATQFYGFGLGLGYTVTEHSIISTITHPKDSSQVIQQTSYINAGTTSTLRADYHLTLPAFFNKKLRINTNGSLYRSQTPTMTDGQLYNTQNWVWKQTLHLQLLIPDVIETSAEGSYSVTHSILPVSESLTNVFKFASVSLSTRQYLFKHWILNYQISQPFISKGRGLQQAPTDITASIQRQFLPHNKATISISGFNLLNSAAGTGQSTSATSITQTKTQYIGRYFLCTFLLKLNRFKN